LSQKSREHRSSFSLHRFIEKCGTSDEINETYNERICLSTILNLFKVRQVSPQLKTQKGYLRDLGRGRPRNKTADKKSFKSQLLY